MTQKDPTICLSCNKPEHEHTRWTAQDIVASRTASWSHPVRTASGWTLYAPLAHHLSGTYRGCQYHPARHFSAPADLARAYEEAAR